MIPAPLTYRDLIARYGKTMAFDLLLVIERMAKIRNGTQDADEEARLQRALHILEKSDTAA